MPIAILIDVASNVATNKTPDIGVVCDNSCYNVEFTFDDEWSGLPTKTARFNYNGKYTDVVFTGNVCKVPRLHDASSLTVGVFAGDLITTTEALIRCRKSVLAQHGSPSEPAPDVYAQIMALLNKGGASVEQIKSAVQDYMERNPQQGVSDEHIREVTADLLKAAKESGEFDGRPGKDGADGKPGKDGADGQPGKDGKDYVLTPADKKEIADMIEVPSGPGGSIPDNVLTTDDMDVITAAVISALPIYDGEVVAE